MIKKEKIIGAINALISDIEKDIPDTKLLMKHLNKEVASEWCGRVLGMRIEIQDLQKLVEKIEKDEL